MSPRPALLDDEAAAHATSALPGRWHLVGAGETAAIEAAVHFGDDVAVRTFCEAAKDIANAVDHHHRATVAGTRVELRCSTHVPRGVTVLDLELARALTALVLDVGGVFD